jgi:hypothetical protein
MVESQLHGTIDVINNDGLRYKMKIKITDYEDRVYKI